MVSETWRCVIYSWHIVLYVEAVIKGRRRHPRRGAVADIKRAGLPVQGPVSDNGWDMGGGGLKLRLCSAPVGGWER